MENKNVFLAIKGKAKNWEEAIRLCGDALIKKGCVDLDFLEACVEREKNYPTGLPSPIPVAIPHSKALGINKNAICFLKLEKPVKFYRMDSSDEYIETDMIFNLAIKDGNKHIEFLQRLMKIVMEEESIKKCASINIEEVPKYLEKVL